MRFGFDSANRKCFRDLLAPDGSSSLRRDYISLGVFENGVLQLLMHDEGRLIRTADGADYANLTPLPTNTHWYSLAEALHNLAYAQRGNNQPAAALQSMRNCVRTYERLTAPDQNPTDRATYLPILALALNEEVGFRTADPARGLVTADPARGLATAERAVRLYEQLAGITPGKWTYEYDLLDPQGNVRVALRVDSSESVIARVEDYYPFGLRIVDNEFESVGELAVKHLFAGKELQDELGLDWYDFGARMLDPAIGRWLSLDPQAEKSPSITPYSYVLNNPIRYVDFGGHEPTPTTVPSGPQTPQGQLLKAEARAMGVSFGDAFDFDSLARQGYSMSANMDIIEQTQEAQIAVDEYNAGIDSISSFSAGFGDAVWFWCPGCAANARQSWGIKSGYADPYAYVVGSITGLIASLLPKPTSASALAGPPPKPSLEAPVSGETGTGLNKRLIPGYELVTRRFVVPQSGRGVTPRLRQYFRGVAARWGVTGPIDVSHVNTPHVFTRPGDEVVVRAQLSAINRAEAKDIARAADVRRALNDPRLPVRPKGE